MGAPSVGRPRGARGPSLVKEELGTGGDAASIEGYGYVSCEICGMAVPKGMPMEAHLQALKPATGMALKCGSCGKAFVETRALEQHQRFCKSKFAGPATVAVSATSSKPATVCPTAGIAPTSTAAV